MDILGLITSVNKISLVFFVITMGFLGYEFYLFQKDKKRKAKPVIPKFDEKKAAAASSEFAPLIVQQHTAVVKKQKNILPLILLTVALIGGLIAAIVGFLDLTTAKKEPTPSVRTRAQVEVPSPTSALFTPTPIPLAVTSTPAPTLEPTAILLAQADPTASVSPTTEPSITSGVTTAPTTDTQSAPVAGIAKYSYLILGLASMIIIFSFIL